MPYIIQRVSDGLYVSPPGESHSYTQYAERARLFATYDEADKERCPENERIFHYNPPSPASPEHYRLAKGD